MDSTDAAGVLPGPRHSSTAPLAQPDGADGAAPARVMLATSHERLGEFSVRDYHANSLTLSGPGSGRAAEHRE